MSKKQHKQTFISSEYRPKVKGEKMFPQYKNKLNKERGINLKQREFKTACFCLHVRDDDSVINTIKRHNKSLEIIYLTYDDLGIVWNFSYYEGQLLFHTVDGIYLPKSIYNRPFFPEQSHPRYSIFNHLARTLEVWNGKLIGATAYNFHNASKPYQLHTSISQAIHEAGCFSIKMPNTFITNCKNELKEWEDYSQSVVKSCSGIRSHVATHAVFKNWCLDNLKYLPTQFQTAYLGPDMRVHWLLGKAWAVKVEHKEGSIDYRYAPVKSPFERVEIPDEIYRFCCKLAEIENLSMLGADFIKIGDSYVCLECNPNPGWSGFHRAAGDEVKIVQALIEALEAA